MVKPDYLFIEREKPRMAVVLYLGILCDFVLYTIKKQTKKPYIYEGLQTVFPDWSKHPATNAKGAPLGDIAAPCDLPFPLAPEGQHLQSVHDLLPSQLLGGPKDGEKQVK